MNAMSEHRHSIRQKSLLRGIVYFDNNPFAAECLVRDVSEAGARIQFAEPPAPTSDTLELQIPAKGQKHRCRIVWHLNCEMGLAFSDVIVAADDAPMAERVARLEAELQSLKQIVRTLQRERAASNAA
jgi:hypothetical protein